MSGELENVCSAFRIFHLSFTVPELLLLPVYDGYYRVAVLEEVARRRLYFRCVGPSRKCMHKSYSFYTAASFA